jgi:hypothetical protein
VTFFSSHLKIISLSDDIIKSIILNLIFFILINQLNFIFNQYFYFDSFQFKHFFLVEISLLDFNCLLLIIFIFNFLINLLALLFFISLFQGDHLFYVYLISLFFLLNLDFLKNNKNTLNKFFFRFINRFIYFFDFYFIYT